MAHTIIVHTFFAQMPSLTLHRELHTHKFTWQTYRATPDQLTSLQAIDVLRVVPQQQSLVLQQPDEVVHGIGGVSARVELLCQGKEGSWVVAEEVNVEDGRRLGDAVLPEIVVQTCAWGPGGIYAILEVSEILVATCSTGNKHLATLLDPFFGFEGIAGGPSHFGLAAIQTHTHKHRRSTQEQELTEPDKQNVCL